MSEHFPETDFCVIDTETTGGSAAHNRVIDVAVFHVRAGKIVDKFQSLINPERPIPQWITGLTGIDDTMVERAPRFVDVADALEEFLGRGIFTAHNAPFDYSFIREEFMRAGRVFERPRLCTVRLARRLLPELPSRSLGMLCEHLLIDIWDRHRAAGDAEATVYVLKDLLRKASREHGVTSWKDLEKFLTSTTRASSKVPCRAPHASPPKKSEIPPPNKLR
jgi:DNA polymerase-3 subunit epsilon